MPPDDYNNSAFRPAAAVTGPLPRFGREALFLDDQPVAQSLVVALPLIMVHEFPDGLPQGSFSEQDARICERLGVKIPWRLGVTEQPTSLPRPIATKAMAAKLARPVYRVLRDGMNMWTKGWNSIRPNSASDRCAISSGQPLS